MTLLNAPGYDEKRENLHRNLLIGSAALVVLAVVLGLAGYILGHGWFFTNFRAEHRVNQCFDAIQAKNFNEAYAIWMNDPNWQQHPSKYDYSLSRFTEDWTTASPVNGPIVNHHVDISKTDGTGAFGTGIIVAVRVNGDHKLFMWYQKSDGTLTYPAPHVLDY